MCRYRRLAGRIVVGPGNVIVRGGGDHGDVVPRRQVLGDQPAVPFRSAGDVGAVPVDHAGQLHVG
jgi:hypothetical protein